MSDHPIEFGQKAPENVAIASHDAMATTFRIHIFGESEAYARKACREVFAGIDRIEMLLSRFREGSDVHRIRTAVPGEVLNVSEETRSCLLQSFEAMEITNGVFNIFIGDLMDQIRDEESAVGFDGNAPSSTGGPVLQLDPEYPRLKVNAMNLALDFGAIGKGFALDQVSHILREWKIDNYLLSGGGSSVLAAGHGAGKTGWQTSLRGDAFTMELCLEDCAVGASGLSVKGDHIINLATWGGYPHRRTWVVADNAAMADALSTAFFVMNREQIQQVLDASRSELLAIIESDPSSGMPPVILKNGDRFKALLLPTPA